MNRGKDHSKITKRTFYSALVIIFLLATGTLAAIAGIPQISDLQNPLSSCLSDIYQGATSLTTMLSTADLTSNKTASTPVVPEQLENATLVLTRPSAAQLVPYTDRGFTEAEEASIAWWKEPGFGDNTTEYRNYLRATPEQQKTQYSEAKQIFFNFITKNLDATIAASPQIEDLILFRGINPTVTKSVLNNGTYIEPAYPSTSYDITLSLILFGTRGDDGYKNVLVMNRSKGKDSLFIDEEEREFLLPRNTEWAVIKAVNVDNLTITANFPLLSDNKTTDSVSKVRLIYIRQINRA